MCDVSDVCDSVEWVDCSDEALPCRLWLEEKPVGVTELDRLPPVGAAATGTNVWD